VSPDREHSGPGVPNKNGQRRVASGAAEDEFSIHENTDDGIINVPGDGAVMDEEQVGDSLESVEGFGLVSADRFVGQVAARGDDREPQLAQQKVVERGVWEHDSEAWVPRRDRWRKGGWLMAGLAGQKDDG